MSLSIKDWISFSDIFALNHKYKKKNPVFRTI